MIHTVTSTTPLNALRAFEAAARMGSFTKAARELGVSSAAVSQQVKVLEEFWEETLFIRQGSRIFLTDSGQTAYPDIAHAISTLHAVSDKMQRRERPQKRLTLSVPQSIAETWLAAKLSTLDLDGTPPFLSIRVDDDPIDLVIEKVDMRVFYGHDLYSDYYVDQLFSDHLVAVAGQSFATRHGTDIDAIKDSDFIHTDWGRGFASSPDWGTALRGRRTVDRNQGFRVQSSSIALNLVRHNMGVALIPWMMAKDDSEAGRVVRLNLRPLALTSDYCVAYLKRLKSYPFAQSIVAALKQ